MHRNAHKLTLAAAEDVAVQGLAFLAAEPARLSHFLTLTGLEPGDIRAQAQAPWFLASVLEHLANDESLLLTFAANTSVAPETIAPALALLQRASGEAPPS
jgi:Protein of unknown function (DUF3572)